MSSLARSGRKATNNEHVAIGIDLEQTDLIEDEDDKGEFFLFFC